MRNIIIIPARYASTRFPGKVLHKILGQELIFRVWSKCITAIDRNDVYVATDDKLIREYCIDNDMRYIMTSDSCLTGTDRVSEAYKKIRCSADSIINVQGDEPLIEPDDILKIIKEHSNDLSYVCCGVCQIKTEVEFRNPNIIKVVMNESNELLYASRAAIPTNKNLGFKNAYKQVCIYAFSEESLESFSNQKTKTYLENIEDIEFLRFLEMGYKIKMVNVSGSSIPVDIPEDIDKVEEELKRRWYERFLRKDRETT